MFYLFLSPEELKHFWLLSSCVSSSRSWNITFGNKFPCFHCFLIGWVSCSCPTDKPWSGFRYGLVCFSPAYRLCTLPFSLRVSPSLWGLNRGKGESTKGPLGAHHKKGDVCSFSWKTVQERQNLPFIQNETVFTSVSCRLNKAVLQ